MRIRFALLVGVALVILGIYMIYRGFYGAAFSTIAAPTNVLTEIDWPQTLIGAAIGITGNVLINLSLEKRKTGRRRGRK